jgi:hypothetical protein
MANPPIFVPCCFHAQQSLSASQLNSLVLLLLREKQDGVKVEFVARLGKSGDVMVVPAKQTPHLL